MSETALIPVTGGIPVPDPSAQIQASGKAESTRRLYTRVLAPYLENGGNLAHVDGLRVYAETLPASRRRHLRAAVSLWAKETVKQLKATDTPERHPVTETLLHRLEALPEVVTVPESKGQKAHTWLSLKQVVELMGTCGTGIVGQRDRLVLALLVGAGLRREEWANLRSENVKKLPIGDRMRTVLEIHGKAAKDCVVLIWDRLAPGGRSFESTPYLPERHPQGCLFGVPDIKSGCGQKSRTAGECDSFRGVIALPISLTQNT